MSRTIAQQLLSDAKRGIISKDALLAVCLEKLESISEEDLYNMALEEGFIQVDNVEVEEILDEDFKKLDATQRIIEKVLSRHGE